MGTIRKHKLENQRRIDRLSFSNELCVKSKQSLIISIFPPFKVISEFFILTSGRCFNDQDLRRVYVGLGNHYPETRPENRRKIKTFRLHPDFGKTEKGGYENNLALVRLSQPFNFKRESVSPACLTEENFTIDRELAAAGKHRVFRCFLFWVFFVICSM